MKRNRKTGVFSAIREAAATHRLLSAGTILCAIASVLASLLPPLLLARVIDTLTGGLSLPFTAALLYFGSLALEGVLSSAQETLLEMFGQRMTHALRSEMSRKLTHLSAATLSAQNPGEVAARFSGDVDTVEALFTSGVISMAADACRILSIFAVIAVKNPGLAVLLLLVMPVLTVFTRHVQKRMLSAQLENRHAVAAISGQVPEALHNIRTIHALGLESYMGRRYDRRIGESYAAVEKTNFYDAIYSPAVLVLNAVVVGVVMLLSASGNANVLTLFGMSVGTSVAIINYISRIFSPIESLGMEIQTIQSAMAGVKRIDAFLAQPERTIPATDASHASEADSRISTDSPRGDIAFSHVTFGYGDHPVLADLSFTVKAGEQVTLVGRTGAGKSTVFRLLLGLYQPEKGSITIGNTDVSQISDRARRSCIGCVEQHFARVPGTVLDQITLGDPRITREMAQKAAQLAGLDAAIRSFPSGYDTPCSDGMFSQGEWQLLSIARAAAADPAILLLDEITANLDAETEAQVLDALRRASAGRTVLSISHRVYETLGGRTIEIKPLQSPA
ncbi:MAG: ABC transporter ATP-binding protein/permease [Clostridiales bacterium]|nr:ABC transporter ATP-binding protein/permease [Clostridiales bacterium]